MQGAKIIKKVNVKPIFHCDAKTLALGPGVGLTPPTPQFCVGDTNMLVSKNAKICVTPNANSKICIIPTQTPNASQWNIGGVGSSGIGTHVGHVYFMLFVHHFPRCASFSALATRKLSDAKAVSVEYRLYCCRGQVKDKTGA